MSVNEADLDAHLPADDSETFRDWSVGRLLADAVAKVPDQDALIVPATADGQAERRWTYRELEASAQQVAQALLARFKPGDRVATFMPGSAEVVLLHLGAALAGVVLVTLNPASRAAELEYLLSQSQARGLFLSREYRGMDNAGLIGQLRPKLPKLDTVLFIEEWERFLTEAAGAVLPTVKGSDPVMILFTSGTTGKPKGAVLRHNGVVNNASFSTARLQSPERSVWLNVLPMFHVGGSVTMTLGIFSNFGTQVLLAQFDAEAMLAALARYRVRLTMAVPTMLVAMMQSEAFAQTDLSGLEVIVVGGTAVAPEMVRKTRESFGVEVMSLFGQTEAGGVMCVTRRGDDLDRVTQSVGAPMPRTAAKVLNPETGAVVRRGEIGEICVRTPCCMLEYFQMPEKTAETLDAEGWVHTGDLGIMRDDGYLQVTGRLKDMIIRGGENIYPREIEDVLAEHAAVSQAAVFGVADSKWGEQVAAAVVLKPNQKTDDEALIAYLREKIARHKVPRIWRFVDTLPVNASGKIMKFVLREQFEKDAGKTSS